MKLGIVGTGVVARTLADKLLQRTHDVMMGTRNVAQTMARSGPGPFGGLPFPEWRAAHPALSLGSFADAAAHGEMVINATGGEASLDALTAAGAANLAGKILIDVSNPLDFSHGRPPTLLVCNTDSLGEQIQAAFPASRVVKTLNTMTANVMVNPRAVAGGAHHLFLCGNDADAKSRVSQLLTNDFGWTNLLDLGDITAARGMEMILPMWLRLMTVLKTPMFNFHIAQ
jgi:predicted dinucleotide-binding enzyme